MFTKTHKYNFTNSFRECVLNTVDPENEVRRKGGSPEKEVRFKKLEILSLRVCYIESFDPCSTLYGKHMFMHPISISLKWPILTVSPLFENSISALNLNITTLQNSSFNILHFFKVPFNIKN